MVQGYGIIDQRVAGDGFLQRPGPSTVNCPQNYTLAAGAERHGRWNASSLPRPSLRDTHNAHNSCQQRATFLLVNEKQQ